MITPADLRALADSVVITAPTDLAATVRAHGRRRARRSVRLRGAALALVVGLGVGAGAVVLGGADETAQLQPAQRSVGPSDDELRDSSWWSTSVQSSRGARTSQDPGGVVTIDSPTDTRYWSRSGAQVGRELGLDGTLGPLVATYRPYSLSGLTIDQVQALPTDLPGLLEVLLPADGPPSVQSDQLFGGAPAYLNSPALLPVRRALLDGVLATGSQAPGRDSLGRAGVVMTRVTNGGQYVTRLVLDVDDARVLESTFAPRDAPEEFERSTLVAWSAEPPPEPFGD